MKWPRIPREAARTHIAMGGVATLLLLLILVTPALENGGVSQGGTLLSRGEVIIDYLPNGTVNLYVMSYGNVRFSSISMGVNLSTGALPRTGHTPLKWDRWANVTDRIELSVSVPNATDFAVNVTTVFSNGGSSTYTVSTGVYGFLVDNSPGGQTLTAYPLSGVPVSGPQSWPLSKLPQALVLSENTRTLVAP